MTSPVLLSGLMDVARLMGLIALLLSFAIIAVRRGQPMAYAAQSAAVGCAGLCHSLLQADWTLAVAVVVMAVQGWLLWITRPPLPIRAVFPVIPLCAALLLVVLATASASSEGMAVPLAMVMLGLLGAAALPGPYGVLSLLNGVMLGMIVLPGFPLRLLTACVLAALAGAVVTDGRRPAWVGR